MPVDVDYGYAERSWTGAEVSFNPNMVALDAGHVAVLFRNLSGVISTLTPGAHISVNKAGSVDAVGAISASPLAMPSEAGTVIFQRTTPATNSTDFENLEGYDPDVHTRLADASALRDAELLGRQLRSVTPWVEATPDYVDFGDRVLRAKDPVGDRDVATKLWVLTVTGILDLAEYVTQCAAYAAQALASRLGAETAQGMAEAARDKSELWAETPEDVAVEPGAYSAKHYAAKAAAAAGTVVPLLSNLDWGTFSAAPTDNFDFGSTWT